MLGLTLVLDQPACRIFQVSPTGFLGVCNTAGRPPGALGMMFTFLVEDVQKTYRHLLARGVQFDGAPEPRGGRTLHSAFCRDPVGYWLEIEEFTDPRWPYPEGRGPRRT